jgi:single-strand DNA-binding protein
MASLNKVILIGNLTRDPELRYIPSGSAVATFSLAINRVYKLQTGEKKEEVTFIRVVVWGRMAEVCGEYLTKGAPVFVEGRLQTRSWDDKDGTKKNTTEVIAQNIQFLKSGGGKDKDLSAHDAPKDDVGEIQLDEMSDAGKEETPF